MRVINNVSEKDLQGGVFSSAQFYLATHCKSTACRVWDFEKGFLECQYIIGNPISYVFFIDPFPLLLIVDIKGTVYLFSTKHHLRQPNQLLTQWKNMYSIQKSSQITFLSSIHTHNTAKTAPTSQSSKAEQGSTSSHTANEGSGGQRCELILGDEYGYIRIIDISAFIEENNVKPMQAESIGNKNPYRIEDYNYLGQSENASNTYDFSHA